MSKSSKASKVLICTSLICSILITGCGSKSKDSDTDKKLDTQSDIVVNDILSTGGNFTKIVILSNSNSNDTHVDEPQVNDNQENAVEEPVQQEVNNQALRPNIGLACMNIADLKGGLNVSDDKSNESDKLETTLDGYTKYNVKYNTGCTINDFDKDIRYFCWSLPDDTMNTFVNALSEICKEHGYLHDGFKVTKNTYHTKNYEHYIYEIANKDHIITIAINYNNTEEVYYTTKDK